MSRVRAPFVRAFSRLALVVACVTGVLGLVGGGPLACGSTATADSFVPITGIVLRAETLTTGRGCGTGSNQVFKYVAAVFGLDAADVMKAPNDRRYDVLVAADVYDCFSDGLFSNLPATSGNADYALQVFVFNQAAYDAAGGDPNVKGITTRLQFYRAALANDGGAAELAAIDADLKRLRALTPTYSTTCTATQFQLVQTLAVCNALSLGGSAIGTPASPATVTLPTATFPRADGGVYTCDTEFARVRYRSGVGGAFSDIADSPCVVATDAGIEPFVITISPAAAPASYTFEVALIRTDNVVLGQTTCGADTSAGLSSAATCKPVP